MWKNFRLEIKKCIHVNVIKSLLLGTVCVSSQLSAHFAWGRTYLTEENSVPWRGGNVMKTLSCGGSCFILCKWTPLHRWENYSSARWSLLLYQAHQACKRSGWIRAVTHHLQPLALSRKQAWVLSRTFSSLSSEKPCSVARASLWVPEHPCHNACSSNRKEAISEMHCIKSLQPLFDEAKGEGPQGLKYKLCAVCNSQGLASHRT